LGHGARFRQDALPRRGTSSRHGAPGNVVGRSSLASPAGLRLYAGMPAPSNDPLHGVTLERLLNELVEHFGWAELARRVPINCFRFEPSVTSSLRFLRRTPWARTKVEQLYSEWKRSSA
jgi:hypothetical protein